MATTAYYYPTIIDGSVDHAVGGDASVGLVLHLALFQPCGIMDTAMDVDLVPSNKICSTCRKNLVESVTYYKNCSLCRSKNRLKEARRIERRREQNKYVEAHKKMLMESVSTDDDGRGFPTKENAIASGSKSSRSSFAGIAKAKIQLPKLLHELEGKEKKYAIREIKASLQKDGGVSKSLVGQPAKDRVSGSAREFQTATLMYEQLKSKALRYSASGKRLKFHGCYSIVSEPTVSHERRAEMVSKKLQKIPHIFLGSFLSDEYLSDDSRCSLFRDCGCLSDVGRNSTGLSSKAKAPTSEMKCNGIIRVTAELDESHPHGLEGQKIIVYIHH